jgi:transposase-like protein
VGTPSPPARRGPARPWVRPAPLAIVRVMAIDASFQRTRENEAHPESELLAFIRDVRFPNGRVVCPRCACSRVHGWGNFGSRKRYRCLRCRRTFSDLTGSPLAHLKRLELWIPHCEALRQARSVRATARKLGIHRDTAFRWRHRAIRGLLEAERDGPRDEVGVLETYFRFSEKGRKNLPRPPHPRLPGLVCVPGKERVYVFLLEDGRGRRSATRPVRVPHPHRVPLLEELLAPALTRAGTLVVVRGRFSAYALLARRTGRELRVEKAAGSERAEARTLLGSLYAYRSRLRRWMRRFNGVATRYLDRYLAWHRAVDDLPPDLGRGAAGSSALAILPEILRPPRGPPTIPADT